MKKWEWMDRERDTHPWLVTMKKDHHLFYMETLCFWVSEKKINLLY
jgi:hypothetical protein